jgi:hypothetical protein
MSGAPGLPLVPAPWPSAASRVDPESRTSPAGAAAAEGTATGPRDGGVRRVLGYVTGTRLAIFIVGAAALRMLPSVELPGAPTAKALPAMLRPWVWWDGAWYLSIAQHGYWLDPQGQSSVAFFPLYPLLIKLGALIVRSEAAAALLVANAAALGATFLLWRWVRVEAGTVAADESVRWLMVYPFAFFLHAAYAESLYLLLVIGTLLMAREGRWVAAAGLAGLAAVTRPLGALLWPALAWGLWQAARNGAPRRARNWGALALAPLGLVAYLLYCQYAFVDAFAFWHTHVAGWNVGVTSSLGRYAKDLHWLRLHWFPLQGYMQLLQTLRVVLPVVFIVLSIQVFRRLGPVPGLYTVLAVAVGTVYGLESAGREYLAAAPVFAVAGILSAGRQLEGLRMLSMGILLALVTAFLTGHFVG